MSRIVGGIELLESLKSAYPKLVEALCTCLLDSTFHDTRGSEFEPQKSCCSKATTKSSRCLETCGRLTTYCRRQAQEITRRSSERFRSPIALAKPQIRSPHSQSS